MQQEPHHRIVEIGTDRFGNGWVHYCCGHRELFCNFVLGAPPEALGAGEGLPEAVLVELALAGALPSMFIKADAQGCWPGPPGPLLDAWRYRKIVSAWWRKRRPSREAQQCGQASRGYVQHRRRGNSRLRSRQRR